MTELRITIPSDNESAIAERRNFNVQGTIEGTVPDGSLLCIELLDENNNVIRHVSTDVKNNHNLFYNHPNLTKCPVDEDKDNQKLMNFGFPELIVKDINNPLDSLRDATIKCFYNDSEFKAIIVSATDIEHGAVFNDGINYTDENGNPYSYLKEGNYTIRCSLYYENKLLAQTDKDITIEKKYNTAIYRYSPYAHRIRMFEWSRNNRFCCSSDLIVGYLDQYTDDWHYHMGLLKMYRSNDIVTYIDSKVHMFVYCIEEDSTSYSCELAFMQKNRYVEKLERFTAYHYDIGEAVFRNKDAQIVEFKNNLEVYRVDTVNDLSKENYLNLNEESVIDYSAGTDRFIATGNKIAICGGLKPLQLNPDDFVLKDDNTYSINNRPARIEYTISNEKGIKKEERTLDFERYLNKSLGKSVYEFYNLFSLESEETVFEIRVYDSHNNLLDYYQKITVLLNKQ